MLEEDLKYQEYLDSVFGICPNLYYNSVTKDIVLIEPEKEIKKYLEKNNFPITNLKIIKIEEFNQELIKVPYNIAILALKKRIALEEDKNILYGIIEGKRYALIREYYCDRLLIQDENGLYGYLDPNGQIVISPKYREASFFCHGTAMISEKPFFIDVNGNFSKSLLNEKFDDSKLKGRVSHYSYAGRFMNSLYIPNIDANDYIKYVCLSKDENKFWTKDIYYYVDYRTKKMVSTYYRPVRQYFNFMVFYISNNIYWQEGYYLFDKNDKSYTYLTSKNTFITFFENYFILANTCYYVNEKIIPLGSFKIDNRVLMVKELISKDEYLRSKPRVEKDNGETLKLRKLKETEYLHEIKLCQLKIKEYEKKQNELLGNLNKVGIERIEVPKDFFINENGVKIVNYEYQGFLKYFDLFCVDFTNVLITGLDFSDSNALIDPQKVYNKDLSNGNYSDVTWVNYDMHGVKIEGAVFNNDFLVTYQECVGKVYKLSK